MIRVDSHCHFWEPGRGDYAWLERGGPALQPIARDFLPGDLTPLRAQARVDRVVVVQAAATEAETGYLLDLADRHEEIAGVVGWVDLRSGDVAGRLERLSRHGTFKGIRPMLQDIDDTNWIERSPQSGVGRVLVELGLRFDALVQPRHLPVMQRFCERNPALPVVIDHAAKPESILEGDAASFAFWADHMKTLADTTDVRCKFSGLLTEIDVAGQGRAATLLRPYVDHLLETFGPERLMWGSDWPVLTLVSDYSSWHDLALELLEGTSEAARERIFGGTAADFYGLEGAT